ncbi:pentatricopeptide repeat [Trichoderma arundinaceum]|uniref:Pentatricopeptide repeat n=1 Tax=Trichoderma arundinaceum TaxID=490622 RepID=A0A395NKS8_TRIAR|nr:pentatricopeptide repeat [Trichoderma arundinaceum]
MSAAPIARASSLKSRCLMIPSSPTLLLRPRFQLASTLSWRQLSSVAQSLPINNIRSFENNISSQRSQSLTISLNPHEALSESVDPATAASGANSRFLLDKTQSRHQDSRHDGSNIHGKQLSPGNHGHSRQNQHRRLPNTPKKPYFVGKRRYMITYDRIHRSSTHNTQPSNRFSVADKDALKSDEPSQEASRELKNLREMHLQWGYIRHQYSASQLQSARKAFTYWKTKFWKVSRVDKPEEPKVPWPWRDNAKWLFELNGVANMQKAWKSLDMESRRKQWPLVMLSTLDRCPEKAHMVLEATLDPLPPGYAINDVLLFTAQRLRISSIKNVRERTIKAEEVLEVMAKVIEDAPTGYVPLGQRTAGLLARKLPSDQTSELFSMLQRANIKLHPNTQLQFAGKLAGDMAHKDTAFGILKNLAENGVDLNAPSPSSAITTLLHCRITHGSLSDRKSSFSPKDTLEYFMDKGFVPNVINATAFLDSLCQQAEVEEAIRLALLFSESGVQLDAKAWATIFRGAKGSLTVENVVRSLDVAKAANAPYVDVLNNALHAVFYFAEMESREKRFSAPWIYPLFGPMLRAYAKKFELEPLQWWLPDSLPLMLTQTTGNDGEKFDSNRPRQWEFLETIVPLTENFFSTQSSGPKLQPNTTTIAIMLRSYIKTLQHPYDLMAFYTFFKARLEEQGGQEGFSAQLIKDQGSLIHDTIIMAMMERRGLSRPALQVFGDMLKDHLQRTASENTEGSEERLKNKQSSAMAPIHPPPGLCTFSILVRGLLNSGDRILAEQVIQVMKEQGVEPNLVTWNTLTKGYAAMQNINKTVFTLQDMEAAGFKPDLFTFRAFGKLKDQGRALERMEGIIDVNRQRIVGEDLYE